MDKDGLVGTPGITLPDNHSGMGFRFGDAENRGHGFKREYIELNPDVASSASEPDYDTYGNIFLFGQKRVWAVDDEAGCTFFLPNDYVPGTDIYVGVDWETDGTSTNPVVWTFSAWNCEVGGAESLQTMGSVTNGPPGSQYVRQESFVTVTPNRDVVNSRFLVTLKRETYVPTGSDNPDRVFASHLFFDYQSTGTPTKNRVDPYYS